MSRKPVVCHRPRCAERAWGSSSQCRSHQPAVVTTTLTDRTCVTCGDTFSAPKRQRAVTCSQSCKLARTAATQARWKAANAARVSKVGAIRYARDAERIRTQNRAWSKAHPQLVSIYKRANKAQRRYAEQSERFNITPRDIRRVMNRCRNSCYYCQESLTVTHWDHVLPMRLGGRTSIGNLVPACPKCNLSKGSKPLSVWLHRRELLTSGGQWADLEIL